jgi:arylformamidase
MRWLDISTPIRDGMPVYPGDPPVRVTRASAMARGDIADVSELTMSAHVGTHVDAPAHAIPGGAGVEGIAIDTLIGPALVLDVPADRTVDAELLDAAGLPADRPRLLLRSGADAGGRPGPGGSLTVDGARHLIDRGVLLVGTDTMSVAPEADPMPVHRLLLAAGLVIVEGLRLSGAPAGDCDLVCLPLLIPGADGAPARAVIRPADPTG